MRRLFRAIWLFLLIAHMLANGARVPLALWQAQALPDLPTTISPVYLAAFGALWCLAFAGCILLAWQKRNAAARVTICVAVAYQAGLWLNHVAFDRSSESQARSGFLAVWSLVNIAVLGASALIASRAPLRAPFQPSDNH
jgi:hypothetical protein